MFLFPWTHIHYFLGFPKLGSFPIWVPVMQVEFGNQEQAGLTLQQICYLGTSEDPFGFLFSWTYKWECHCKYILLCCFRLGYCCAFLYGLSWLKLFGFRLSSCDGNLARLLLCWSCCNLFFLLFCKLLCNMGFHCSLYISCRDENLNEVGVGRC